MKIRSSLEVKQKSGEFVGSFAPYGYMKSPENKNQLIVDEAVSEYVQMIFSTYKDGFSIGRIARSWLMVVSAAEQMCLRLLH